MKELFTDAISKKLSATLESVGGAKAVFGDPVVFNGEQLVPVARIVVKLSAGAEGSGGGNAGAGLGGGLANLAKGGGGGNAEAGVQVTIEPVGFLRQSADGPIYIPLDAAR